MEYLPFPTLRELLDEKRRLGEKEAIGFARQLALALQACHRAGVVHRDVKASNILIKDESHLILADFGLVRCQEGTRITATGGFVGTPLYLPPEALFAPDVDCRGDIYQLGVVFHEMLTGRELIEDVHSMTELLTRIASPDFDPAECISKTVSSRLSAILVKALARDREERIQTVDEFLDVLDGKAALPSQARKKSRSAPALADKGRQFSLVYGAFVLVVLFVALACFVASPSGKSGGKWSVKNFALDVRQRSVELSWTSDVDYRSVVSVHGEGLNFTSKATEVTTRAHHVVVRGLQPRTNYYVSVVFPSGESSIARRFKTEQPSMSVESKELFTACLEELLHNPQSSSEKRLVDSIQGKDVSFCSEPWSEAVVLNSCSRIQEPGVSMEVTLARSALVYKALLMAAITVAEKIPPEKATSLFITFFVNSVNYFRDYRHCEDTYRTEASKTRTFKLSSLGVAGRASCFNLMNECENRLSKWIENHAHIPPPIELIYYKTLSDALLIGRAEIGVRNFRKRLMAKGLEGPDFDLLKAYALLIEAAAAFKMNETQKSLAIIDEAMKTTDSFAKDWDDDPHKLTLWSLASTYSGVMQQLFKDKENVPREQCFEKLRKIVSHYGKTKLARRLKGRFMTYNDLTDSEEQTMRRIVAEAAAGGE